MCFGARACECVRAKKAKRSTTSFPGSGFSNVRTTTKNCDVYCMDAIGIFDVTHEHINKIDYKYILQILLSDYMNVYQGYT